MTLFVPLMRVQQRTATGAPAQGYKLYFWNAGSTTVAKDTYKDEALGVTNTNPVLSDANGWFPPIVLDGEYQVRLTTDADVEIWTLDNVKDIKTVINELITASPSSVNVGVQNSAYSYAVGSGNGDAITLTISPVPTSYTDGMRVQVRGYTGANTISTPTINVNTIGNKTIVRPGNVALNAGDINGASHTLDLMYNSAIDKMVLLNPYQAGTDQIFDGAVTTAKLATDSVTTAKITDSNVTTAKIADSNVTTAKIADSNVTTAKINDAAITPAKMSGTHGAGSAPAYVLRTWIRFTTSGGTPSITGSGNVSSLTDNGVGDFTVNFTQSLAAGYAASGSYILNDSATISGNTGQLLPHTQGTTSCGCAVANDAALVDPAHASLQING